MLKSLKWMALVAFLPAMASAAISTSKHNLSQGNPNAARVNSNTTQICIFCHTPHSAQSTRLLWNHTASTTTSWSWGVGSATTTAGTSLPTAPSTLSARCISCHDGTTALGSVSNVGGGASGSFTMSGTDVTTGALNSGSGYQIGGGGSMSGHHPVGVPWPGSTYFYTSTLSSTSKATSGAADYGTVLTSGCTTPTNVCVTSAAGTGTNISIYGTAGAYGVECMSCHDVHNENGQSYLLRVTLTGSQLCLGCHNK